MSSLLNFAIFQAAWLATVIGAARGLPWVGPAVMAVAVVLHLRHTQRPSDEALLVLSCAAIGLVFDSLLVMAGWVSYSTGQPIAALAPYWIVSLWMLFATTLNVSMRWLQGRPVVAFIAGLVGGPASYMAGEKLGAIVFVERTEALLALGIGWALMMPLLARLAATLGGVASTRGAESFAEAGR